MKDRRNMSQPQCTCANAMCHLAQVADKEAGANCPSALRSAASATQCHPPPKPRFQPNSVDEVTCGCIAAWLSGHQYPTWHPVGSRYRNARSEEGADVHTNLRKQVCFLGPELGPLAGLLVGPQMGSWLLEEAHVSSSRTRHTDRCLDKQAGLLQSDWAWGR
jgi:hypothetical protein